MLFAVSTGEVWVIVVLALAWAFHKAIRIALANAEVRSAAKGATLRMLGKMFSGSRTKSLPEKADS